MTGFISMARKAKKTGKVAVKRSKRPALKGFFGSIFLLPSVTIKVTFLSFVIYVLVLVLYYILKWTFVLEISGQIFGIPFRWFEGIGEIVTLAVAVTISTYVFLERPVEKLRGVLGSVSDGKFNIRADVKGRDELGMLGRDFNRMLTRLTEFNDEKVQAESELIYALEELKYKNRLEKHGKKIKETNKALKILVSDFALLYEIGQRINSTMEVNELYRIIQDVLPTQLDLHKFAILIVDEKREFLNVKAAYGFDDFERIFDLSFRMGEGISGEVAAKGETIYLPDVEIEEKYLHYRGETQETGSFVSIPLMFKKDILGVMNCSRSVKSGFSNDDIRLLTMLANQIALAVENAELYTKTRELSVREELTGLYNRRYFQQVLQIEWKRATRFKRSLSLLMIDIDHFKDFNDTFGHPFGDKVLKVIADLLIKNLREVDTVARFGGEEFVVLLPDTAREGALVVAEKLRHLVEIERFSGEHQRILPLTVSVGIAAFPDDARDMDDLIDHSDVALYEAKDAGRNRVVDYARLVAAIPADSEEDIEVV